MIVPPPVRPLLAARARPEPRPTCKDDFIMLGLSDGSRIQPDGKASSSWHSKMDSDSDMVEGPIQPDSFGDFYILLTMVIPLKTNIAPKNGGFQ